MAVTAGDITGWYGLVLRGETCLLDHLWVAPPWIGQGIGHQLFDHAVALARQRGARRLELESDPHAVGFYARMGAHVIGDVESDMGRRIPYMALTLEREENR